MPYIANVTLKSVSPYSASRKIDEAKGAKETYDEFEERIWREKSNYDPETGEIFIPAMAFKQALDDAAKTFGSKIPGKGNATYAKRFVGGALCVQDLAIGIHRDAIGRVAINANADGVRGSGKRVRRVFPQTQHWTGQTQFLVLDDTISKAVFEKALKDAGSFVGVGRFRRQKGGTNGAFAIEKISYDEIE